MAGKQPRRPNGGKETKVRSVRVEDPLWARAQRRASYEGVTMSHVLYTFIEGYAAGMVDLPKVTTTFAPPKATG